MNLVRDLSPIKPDLPRVTDPAELTVLAAPDCPAAIWSRPMGEARAAWLDRLPASQLPRWREIVAVDAVAEAALDACAEAGTPDSAEREELITEIQLLADTFAKLMKVSAVSSMWTSVSRSSPSMVRKCRSLPLLSYCMWVGQVRRSGSA